jgi:hypothetical protein
MILVFLLLASFSGGIYNIFDLTNDFYSYDTIQNIQRVTENSVIFPAITVCLRNSWKREYYQNNTLVGTEISFYNLSMEDFLEQITMIDPTISSTHIFSLNKNQIEFFQVADPLPCLCFRFNGASNKNLEMISINSTFLYFYIAIKNTYRKEISKDEYFVYSPISKEFNSYIVFAEDNYINSYSKSSPLFLSLGKYHSIKIVKSDMEKKLPAPYNQCKESSPKEIPYRQVNCIESCVSKQIGFNYNCTFQTLYKIDGLSDCSFLDLSLIQSSVTYKKDCEDECLIGCESVKFSAQSTILVDNITNITAFLLSVSDFSTLQITQIPKTTPFAFISNVGGALGLFMGLSFLNFIEMFEFIFEITFITFSY